ncbi:hypothetical protein QUB63_29280 [Microcoleus sp. ARI1-B5]
MQVRVVHGGAPYDYLADATQQTQAISIRKSLHRFDCWLDAIADISR